MFVLIEELTAEEHRSAVLAMQGAIAAIEKLPAGHPQRPRIPMLREAIRKLTEWHPPLEDPNGHLDRR